MRQRPDFVTDEPGPRGDYTPTIRNDVHAIPTKSKSRTLVVIPTNFPQNHSKSNSALIGK
jgi:predicted transcriptional regulator